MIARRSALLAFVAVVSACTRKDPPGRAPPSDNAPASQSARELSSASTIPAAAEPSPAGSAAYAERRSEREEFVRQTIEERGVTNTEVLRAMRKVPRHRFVMPADASRAYTDRPLGIPRGQTISQPYIVAAMTEAAAPTATSKCLEIGTGSGFQAAILAELCGEVFSIEYLPEVAEFGKSNLRRLGYDDRRVHLRTGDGYRGWPEAAPFDVIVVTAAPEEVPAPLLEQLAQGGRLVIPVGPETGIQILERWTRVRAGKGAGAFDRERLMGVRFVPFLGDGGRK